MGSQRSGSASSSSSSSSSARRRKATKAKQPEGLTPEETLERLLQGRSAKRRRRSSGRFSGSKEEETPVVDPADIAADAARAMGAAAAAAAAAAVAKSQEPLKPGDRVEVYGLQSEAGRALNGKTGLITKYVEGRFQVELGLANLQS